MKPASGHPVREYSTVSNGAAERYRRWFDYEKDAHAKVVRSLESVPTQRHSTPEFSKAVGLLAHIVAARRLWLFRLGIVPDAPTSFFPDNAVLADVVAELRQLVEHIAVPGEEEVTEPG